MLLATGVLAAACGSGGAPAQHEPDRGGSVPACTAAALRALEHRVTLTALPGPCQGLSRAHLNLALGRAIYEVAGTGQHKAAWRRRAALAEARLARLIKSLPPAVRPRPVPPPPAAPASRWGTGLAALAAWLLTLGIGAFMLVPWIRRGGLHPRAADAAGSVPRSPWGTPARPAPGCWPGSPTWPPGGPAWAGWPWACCWRSSGSAWPRSPCGRPRRPGPSQAPRRLRLPAPGTQAPARPPAGGPWIIIPIVHGLTASATILLALLTVVTAR